MRRKQCSHIEANGSKVRYVGALQVVNQEGGRDAISVKINSWENSTIFIGLHLHLRFLGSHVKFCHAFLVLALQ